MESITHLPASIKPPQKSSTADDTVVLFCIDYFSCKNVAQKINSRKEIPGIYFADNSVSLS